MAISILSSSNSGRTDVIKPALHFRAIRFQGEKDAADGFEDSLWSWNSNWASSYWGFADQVSLKK